MKRKYRGEDDGEEEEREEESMYGDSIEEWKREDKMKTMEEGIRD